jgi:hypothetical protein
MGNDVSEGHVTPIFEAENQPSMNQLARRWLGHRFLARLIFDPEDADDTFLRNVDSHADYTALYPRRWQLSYVFLHLIF